MATFTLTGVTGAAALLLADLRTRKQTLRPDPLLVPVVLTGAVRVTASSFTGTIDALAQVLGTPNASLPPLLTATVVVDGAFRHRWSSHGPLLVRADLEADASFVRLGDTDPNDQKPAAQFGRVIGVAELTGTFSTAALISGNVLVPALLSQSFNFYDLGDSPRVTGTPVLSGTLNVLGSQRSPPFALFDGTNFLQRSTSDSLLNPVGAFTVSVTFDPELIEAGQNCVIVAKNNQTTTQAGWKIAYAVSTGIVTITVYGAADGSIFVARPTNTAVRTRSRFTAIVDAAGAITIYVNGSTNQGTQTSAGVWVSANASTEPFSMGCDAPSSTGTNRMKGSVYDFAFWNDDIPGAQVALLLPDGLMPDGVDLTDLDVHWSSEDLQASPANGTFSTWVDRVSSLTLAAGNPTGFRQIYCLAREAGVTPDRPPLLFTHIYGSLLADSAAPQPDQTLTTTHRLSTDTRWRLWSAASVTPQIPGYFRQYRGDITITVIFSRVTGANTIVIAKLWGLRMEWQSATNFFVISGDDNVGSTNERFDYSIALPVGRVEPSGNDVPGSSLQVVTLRFNSFTKGLDVLFFGVRNALGSKVTGQSASERHTGLLLAEFGDWRAASVIPACLTDAQVMTMLSAFQPNGYINLPVRGRYQHHPIPYQVSDPPLRPFEEDQDLEPIPLASSSTTVSGVFAYAVGGGLIPNSVRVFVPSVIGTMGYADNGSGQFVAQPGSEAVVSSSLFYVGVAATGSITLTGQPSDGDTVTLTSADGTVSVTFEFDNNSTIVGGRFRVVIGADATASTTNLRAAINQNPLLRITASGAGLSIPLAHQVARSLVSGLIAVVGSNISKSDFTGGIDAGTWSITIVGTGNLFLTTQRGFAAYNVASQGLLPILKPIPFDWIATLLAQVYNSPAVATYHLYADAPYIIKDGFDEDEDTGGTEAFIDPDPIVVSVTVDAAHNITAIANAGPTNAGPVISWWEIELVSGSTEVMVVADYFQPNQFSINRNHTDLFPIPLGQDWNEKRIRFVVQAVSDASQIWRSLFFRMIGDDFDNAPADIIVVPGTPTTPGVSAEDLLTTEERERLVIARRARRPTPITPQSEISRYKTTKVFDGPRGRELGLMEVLDDLYLLGAEFRTHVVTSPEIGFLDRIAVLAYGEGYEWAWWAIAYVNKMVDPDQEMFTGQRLILPPRDALQRFLSRAPVTTLST